LQSELNLKVFDLVSVVYPSISTYQTPTACLAPDQCGIPQGKPRVRVTSSGLRCNPNSDCY